MATLGSELQRMQNWYKEINNKNICNDCLTKETKCPFYKLKVWTKSDPSDYFKNQEKKTVIPKNIRKCSAFRSRRFFDKQIYHNKNHIYWKKDYLEAIKKHHPINKTIPLIVTPKKKEDDLYEKYINPDMNKYKYNGHSVMQPLWEEIMKEKKYYKIEQYYRAPGKLFEQINKTVLYCKNNPRLNKIKIMLVKNEPIVSLQTETPKYIEKETIEIVNPYYYRGGCHMIVHHWDIYRQFMAFFRPSESVMKKVEEYNKEQKKKELYIWQKIIKERSNNKIKGGIKNMNQTNKTKIDILKQKIEKIKEERKKYIEDVKRIYKTDSCLRCDLTISRGYINYIFKQIHPTLSDKKIKKLKNYIILDHLHLSNNPYYYIGYGNNPLSKKSFKLIDATSEDWKAIKICLNKFKAYAEGYIKLKYQNDLKLISDKNDFMICENCRTTNKTIANYCNNCGKEL